MSWKFNPPPGWPQQPEGWQPPPGWAPDPTWPPAPPGWQFWVPADTPPTTPTYQTPTPTVTPTPTATPTPAPTQAYPTSPYQSVQPTPQSPGPYPPGQQPYPGAPGAYPPQPGYVGGYPQPGYPAPAAKPWYQRGGVIALGVAVLVLLTAGVGIGTFLLLSDDNPDDPPVASPSSSPATSASPDAGDDDGGDPGDDGGDDPAPGRVFEGQGSDQIRFDLEDGVFYTVTITHKGGDWFEVYSTDGDDDVTNLAWGIGDHQGTYAINMFMDEDPDGIRIDTSGSWTIELNELSESPGWPDNSSGVGSTVLLVDPGQGDISVTGSHDGESNFIIWAYVENGYPSLLFNEIGPHEGSAVVPANTFALSIIADGNWTLQQR